MHFFQFGNRDTTIFSGGTTSSINTGLDEILEVNKIVANDGTIQNISRILIDFDYANISQSVIEGRIPSTAKYYLNLYDASSEELLADQNLFVYMVSGSWSEGTGKLDHNPVTTDGASYQYRNQDAKTPWVTGSVLTDGGSWFTGSMGGQYKVSSSFALTKATRDRSASKFLINLYSSSLFPNNGFLVKRESLYTSSVDFSFNPGGDTTKDESSSTRLGNLKFFSTDTHTIYPPKLEVVWDDSSWSTGSLSALSSSDLERLKIYFQNLRQEYQEKSIVKLRVVGRELYPTTTFATTPSELTIKYLPSASVFYSVRDAETEEVIIPFGSGSAISCDSTSNFFNIQMDAFQAERNYRFLVQVVSGSGASKEINIYDDEFEFRVVR